MPSSTTTTSFVWRMPARTSDIRYLVGNDRYQVVVLANEGTSTTPPEFRYWFAGPPDWESSI